MNPIAIDLQSAARHGRERALHDATATAATTDGGGLDAAMSRSAEHTLFSEAILAAAKARFAEIKAVTK